MAAHYDCFGSVGRYCVNVAEASGVDAQFVGQRRGGQRFGRERLVGEIADGGRVVDRGYHSARLRIVDCAGGDAVDRRRSACEHHGCGGGSVESGAVVEVADGNSVIHQAAQAAIREFWLQQLQIVHRKSFHHNPHHERRALWTRAVGLTASLRHGRERRGGH